MKRDSVICPSCGAEFELALVEMVRRKHPWCESCIEHADRELQEAARRARESELIPEGR